MNAPVCLHQKVLNPSLGVLPSGTSFYSRRWKKKTVGDQVYYMLQLRCPECSNLFQIASDGVCKLPCGDGSCTKVHYQSGNHNNTQPAPVAAVSPATSTSSTGTPPPLDDDPDLI
eukprot:TRINITY_DN4894_c1_g1_i1.p1 TRINITY_DN4894_c1_g1~~TRINITY_DN4894_c1_g1_i1.p1  ORF type:complete len:115 (+),score=10.23 TRINITY_DN4894_c1_g1_i1:48-392(+)